MGNKMNTKWMYTGLKIILTIVRISKQIKFLVEVNRCYIT